MKQKGIDIDWAVIIDLFASQYGWTIDYITGLTLGQVIILLKQIKKRCNTEDIDVPNVSEEQEEMTISDFETKLGGKKIVDEDGVTKIVI